MPKIRETPFFETRQPDPMRCATCGRSGPELEPESRPTGADGRVFRYPLCEACRLELQQQRANRDPAVAKGYQSFIRFVLTYLLMAL